MHDYIALAERDPAEATRRDQQFLQVNPLVEVIEREMAESRVDDFEARKEAASILDLQGGLEHPLRKRKVVPQDADVSAAEAKLFDIGSQLKRWQEDGAMFLLPDLEEHFGLTLNDARRLLFNNSDLQELASLYYGVAGKAGIVRINYQSNRQFFSYTEGLAEDLAPMLILDASGRVRNTYKAWRERWKTLLTLPSAPKSYRTVEINLANLPAGETLFIERKKEKTIQLRASILKADAALIAEHRRQGGWSTRSRASTTSTSSASCYPIDPTGPRST